MFIAYIRGEGNPLFYPTNAMAAEIPDYIPVSYDLKLTFSAIIRPHVKTLSCERIHNKRQIGQQQAANRQEAIRLSLAISGFRHRLCE